MRKTTQRESSFRSRVVRELRKAGAEVHVVHQTAYSRTGDPDLIGVWRGRAFAIELKRPGGGEPTPLQQEALKRWKRAGARTGSARSMDEVWRIVRGGAVRSNVLPHPLNESSAPRGRVPPTSRAE